MKTKMLLPLLAATALVAPAPSWAAEAPVLPPKLIVAISVDQFSADLFAEYRSHYIGGLRRLQQGAVFPATYHAHAATETCPGHATLLTGSYPARTGIIANTWFDLEAKRADKAVYCAEDETAPGTSSTKYLVSPDHLKMPTLGDRMKAVDPRSRVYAVSGKDRGAVMMAGHKGDQVWWWNGKSFATFADRSGPAPSIVQQVNANIATALAAGIPAPALPELCQPRVRAIPLGGTASVGSPLTPLPAGAAGQYRTRPDLDRSTLEIAAGMVDEAGLGKGPAPDLLAVSLSVTDYIGHTYGPGGAEMCTQMVALDAELGRFFARLDASGVPYAIMLSADHGGHDIPERNREHALPDAQRSAPALTIKALNEAMGAGTDPLFFGEGAAGDVYLAPRIKGKARARLLDKAKAWFGSQPQVQVVFDGAELKATPRPTLPPEAWTLVQRAAASYLPGRSGDLVVLLKPRVTPIADPTKGYVATHGSAWDYDRRVPMLYWWPGITGFEQPNSVQTVDILPTLAALIELPIKAGEIDGQCRDLDAGPGSTCR